MTGDAFRDAAQATYASAVASLAALYPGTPEVFALPAWRQAESAIEAAYLRSDLPGVIAAVAAFERIGRTLCEEAAGEAATCEHADDLDLRAWRAENPLQQCARCWIERGK